METARTAHTRTQELIELAERYAAHNYHPLPVVIASGDGAWVTDVEGKRYLDMLAAYSALNFGHRHPRLVEAARAQLELVTLTSRAFHNDTFPVFCRDLAHLANKDMVLTMNTGAEAVETAIKTARRWGYDVKGVAPTVRRSSWPTGTSTGERSRSSGSRMILPRGADSARSPRGSGPSRTETWRRSAPPKACRPPP
jgi:hypothetical protein